MKQKTAAGVASAAVYHSRDGAGCLGRRRRAMYYFMLSIIA
jgi:hypothetical protein